MSTCNLLLLWWCYVFIVRLLFFHVRVCVSEMKISFIYSKYNLKKISTQILFPFTTKTFFRHYLIELIFLFKFYLIILHLINYYYGRVCGAEGVLSLKVTEKIHKLVILRTKTVIYM